MVSSAHLCLSELPMECDSPRKPSVGENPKLPDLSVFTSLGQSSFPLRSWAEASEMAVALAKPPVFSCCHSSPHLHSGRSIIPWDELMTFGWCHGQTGQAGLMALRQSLQKELNLIIKPTEKDKSPKARKLLRDSPAVPPI